MSGIVGLYNLHGAPIPQWLLRRMTDALAFRGPDAQTVWSQDFIGLGHALLRTTDEAASEQQPLSFDGKVWIIADARIDGRAELQRKLAAHGSEVALARPDVEFVLHTYLAWGERCVDHLLGDFAFAIWDGKEQTLFCARDHFGVKPFYYAHVGKTILFGNTLAPLRLHPAVSERLDDLFIGDFLLFGGPQNTSRTIFADLRRLPPAHTLTVRGGRTVEKCYWQLAEQELRHDCRATEYVEQFQHLFRQAVADRLRTKRVAVWMSGGLDSTAIAATAKQLLTETNGSCELRGFTTVYSTLFADPEEYYAGAFGRAASIPVSFQQAGTYAPFSQGSELEAHHPEPSGEPFLAAFLAQAQEMQQHGRVVLTGLDGDSVLNEWSRPYLKTLFQTQQWGRLLRAIGQHIWYKREIPQIGFRYWLRNAVGAQDQTDDFPTWIEPSFAERYDLHERWAQFSQERCAHSFRPHAYGTLRSPHWPRVFETHDEAFTRLPLEFRHPLADVRLIKFLLAVPPVPWMSEKEILRQAMRGVLPEVIRRRPKTALAADPLLTHWQRGEVNWLRTLQLPALITPYVRPNQIAHIAQQSEAAQLWQLLLLISLAHWLRSATGALSKPSEVTNELTIGCR